MADQSLQAFQLGASLFDRAQTQKRMMEQLQMQTADQIMRQRQADLQNKIQSKAYADALAESEAQNLEYDAFQNFNQQVSDFLNSTTEGAAMPALPRFKSKQFNQEATRLVNGLEPYSARAELIKKQTKVAALADQLEGKRYDNAIKYNAITRTADGKYIIDDALIAKKRDEEEKLNRASKVALTGSKYTKEGLKAALDRGDINQEEYTQYLPTARAEGGVVGQRAEKVINSLKNQGVITNEDEQLEAESFLLGPEGGKTPTDVLKSINAANSAVTELNDAFKKIQQFEQKYGANSFSEYVGPLDNPLLQAKGKFKGITAQEQKDAVGILNKIRLVRTDYQQNKFGATLTPSEERNLETVVSNPSRADYINVVDAFRNNLTSGVENKIWDYRYSPSIAPEIRKRYIGGARQKLGLTQPVAAAPSTEQPISPQDVFKNIRANRSQGGTIQPTTPPASNRVGRFEMFIEGQ